MKISNELNSSSPLRGVQGALAASALRSSGRRVSRTAAADPSALSKISAPGKLLARAARDLSADRDVRPEVVAAARAQVRDWSGLDQTQLTELAAKIVADLA